MTECTHPSPQPSPGPVGNGGGTQTGTAGTLRPSGGPPQTPAGEAPDASPAAATPLRGKEAMDAVRRARSELAGQRIRDLHTPAWKRRKKNPFGNAGPGMVRRMPQKPPEGGDAA